jgi:plastocyanin
VNVKTTVPFVGTKSFTVTLKKGTYRFVCDPHATAMKGSFKVS